MVKIAKTEEEKQRCIEYLQSKGVEPIYDFFMYVEREGRITACSGLVLTGFIEPFACDNSIDGFRVTQQAQGYLRQHAKFVCAMTNRNKKVLENIYEKDGFWKWNSDINLYVKEL